MNSWVTLGLILGIMLVASVALDYELYANNNNYTPLNLSDTPLILYAVNSTNDLNLTMSLSNLSILPGQSISVVIDESNTLNTTNIVNASDAWPLYLARGPCGPLNDPMGVAFFKGYYTASNISSATSLVIYHPGTYNCPAIVYVVCYVFQPLSDNATIYGKGWTTNQNVTTLWGGLPFDTWPMSAEVTVNGYWTDSPFDALGTSATFHNLEPGVYTVAGGDEWGQLLILHFEVT